MKTTLLLLCVALTSTAFAGTPATYSGKGGKAPVQPIVPLGCDCFAPGFTYGFFGGAELPSEDSFRDDGLGGGILGEYFFTENIGIQASYGAFAPNPVHHIYGADLVVRFPIRSLCIAPYILGGGGAISNGDTLGYVNAGAGIDVRFPSFNCIGIFADGAYHWTEESDENFTLIRLGVKIPL